LVTTSKSQAFNVLWLQGASCGGCTMAVLESGQSGWFDELKSFGIRLIWHPSVSEATGEEALSILQAVREGKVPLHALVLEGSVVQGPNRTGRFNMLAGTGRSMYHWIVELAPLADYVLGVGTCATYGGISLARGDARDQHCGLRTASRLDHGNAGGIDERRYRSRRPRRLWPAEIHC